MLGYIRIGCVRLHRIELRYVGFSPGCVRSG
jgi:hypothetical protein